MIITYIHFQVSANNGCGYSNWSNVLLINPSTANTPNTPTANTQAEDETPHDKSDDGKELISGHMH